MGLDQAQQGRLNIWMQTKGVKPQCPACGNLGSWTPGDVIAPPVMTPGTVTFGGPSVPMVQLICGKYAYILHFAAVPMELV